LEDLPEETESKENSEISPVRPHSQKEASEEIGQIMASITRSVYRGPIPPPEILKGYDLVKEGFAERVFQMAERQSQHRMELEKTVVIGDHKKSWVGLVLGFLIACGVFYGSYDLVKIGHDTAGTILGGSALATLVGIFVRGSNQRSRERIKKSKELDSSSDEND
jgi:uncharacterized membrane protein